jgi:acetyl/propionyl-CoA carboxylase alpha subunit
VTASRPVSRLLVANRGEIARRVFRTCRQLGIGTVAVFSDADADAFFVAEADEAVALGGASPQTSYLRGEAIVAAAIASEADAVHPGYGFLAENAGFAQAVLDAGLTWIGPAPETIARMGSKTEARELMERAGVPVLPGRRLDDGDDNDAAAAEIGFPLLVKAAAGGGGKGMRLVESPADLAREVRAARREAASAFGDDTVFLERFAVGSRHVEIQILGDLNGSVVSLHERDCSIQRRHQKVIEEAPSPALEAGLRERMAGAAVAAGEALGYVGAGTVEFLLTAEREFFFLEVNTRLQVEHPVTELVTGLDLVEQQIAIAEGGAAPATPALDGHAIEARLYAEDAGRGFLPATGTVTRFRVPEGVRVDAGVESGSEIGPHYDPMIAKVIAHGPTREVAARRLADALARTELHGVITNRDLLVRTLRHEEFLAGEADTSFLERHDPAALARPLQDPRLAAAAAALAMQAGRRAGAPVLATAPSGWRNVPSQRQRLELGLGDDAPIAVEYRFDRRQQLAELEIDGEPLREVRLHHASATSVDLEIDGRRRRYRVRAEGALAHVNTHAGQVSLDVLSRHPRLDAASRAGTLAAPMPGTVIRLMVEAGQDVDADQPLLILEAMKMEHEIVAPAGGSVAELNVSVGSQVDAGAILAVIEGPS